MSSIAPGAGDWSHRSLAGRGFTPDEWRLRLQMNGLPLPPDCLNPLPDDITDEPKTRKSRLAPAFSQPRPKAMLRLL